MASLSGRTAFPKLLPEVFISDVHLPVDRIIRHQVQLLDIATLGKWGGRYALPLSQVMVIRARRHLTRRVDNYVKMDPLTVWGPRSQSARDHAWDGFAGVVEHWAHFHMKRGFCFLAPAAVRSQ